MYRLLRHPLAVVDDSVTSILLDQKRFSPFSQKNKWEWRQETETQMWITGKRADGIFKHLKISSRCRLVSCVNTRFFFLFALLLVFIFSSVYLHLSPSSPLSLSFSSVSTHTLTHTHLSQVQCLKLVLLPVCVCLPNCLAQEVLVAASRHSQTWLTWSSCLINPSTPLFFSPLSPPQSSHLHFPIPLFTPLVPKMPLPLN